jgi:uncharacterized damage-inducible protein DinB
MRILLASIILTLPLLAADAPPTPAKIWDGQISSLEKEFIPLVEAMPADKFGFVPKGDQFAKSRTFGEQARHIATVVYEVAAAIQETKNPVEPGAAENGPDLKSKEEIVKYCKDAFASAHKAALSLTNENLAQAVKSPFGGPPMTKMSLISIIMWHSFDHYGQMVIYARMNGIVPPASR